MSDQPRCTYELVEDNLHELTFTEVSREAVDEFAAHLDRLLRAARPDDTVGLISNNQLNKPQSTGYALSRTRAVLHALPQRPAVRAALLDDGFFAKIVDGLFRTVLLRRDRLRVFRHHERAKMLDWLRRDD